MLWRKPIYIKRTGDAEFWILGYTEPRWMTRLRYWWQRRDASREPRWIGGHLIEQTLYTERQRGLRRWWFIDETGYAIGPYWTRRRAERARERYAATL